MVLTIAGPLLAEEEMLHDGEPVFGWVWNESNECPAAAPRRDAVNKLARRTTPRPIEGVRQCRP